MIDFVIPYCLSNQAAFSIAQTCGKRLEIEYVIASIKKFCPWHGRIFVVGPATAPDAIAKDVICIECPDPYVHIKDANIINKIKVCIESVKDLSNQFIMASDDQIVTRIARSVDCMPTVNVKATIYESDDEFIALQRKNNVREDDGTLKWRLALQHTLRKFPDRPYMFQPHKWTMMERRKFIDMCNTYDIAHDDGIVIFTLYGNFAKCKILPNTDHIWLKHATNQQIQMLHCRQPLHLAWDNGSFNEPGFRAVLDNICFKSQKTHTQAHQRFTIHNAYFDGTSYWN